MNEPFDGPLSHRGFWPGLIVLICLGVALLFVISGCTP